ncbi:hypothetical protein [Rugamonas rubra]|jgi:hypothetical protein|uniref:Uncharacterized protein n=1 Tax=Rugamonas rubra TaxID=758825 RepID=A0A1I4M2Z3_9BURK|nr:hypothetical protein [Rugamonas rubra]SFL97758.1 hypothetical protein SAMN02982985_02217 [Rugamonas rubra]
MSRVGGPAPSNDVHSPADDKFRDGLANKSDNELKGMLKSGDLKPGEMKAVIDELASRKEKEMKAEEAGGSGDAGEGGSDELAELLKKLKSGKITPEELDKLAGMLGVDPKALEKAAGKGGGDEGGEDGDIKD